MAARNAIQFKGAAPKSDKASKKPDVARKRFKGVLKEVSKAGFNYLFLLNTTYLGYTRVVFTSKIPPRLCINVRRALATHSLAG